MSDNQITPYKEKAVVPFDATPNPAEVARIRDSIDIGDRAGIAVFGEGAQQSVVQYADRILAEVRNKDIGETGKLLTDIILKSKELDPASIQEQGFLARLFSSAESRLERFKSQFENVAGQIERIALELDGHKDTLRRDIAVFDHLYDETRTSIARLDTYIEAGKSFAQQFRDDVLPRLQITAQSEVGNDAGGALAAQSYQDKLQALDRLEKRVFYLQQARQIGIQQLPQIRIVQSGNETLIENLQATTSLAVPAWKQKMVIMLGLSRQKAALELQKTVTDATNEMLRQTSEMMKGQAIGIEEQAQRGIVDIETLKKTNTDLIDTITGVLRVQEEGRARRQDAERQMDAMTAELKKTLTSK